jgi:hypothetical protein
MAVCELVQRVSLCGRAIEEPEWSAGEARRLALIEREQTRRWIEAAALAEARIRGSAGDGAADRTG